jgi:phosphoenolpyruvate synthase/pyruvate phosphate dikinase
MIRALKHEGIRVPDGFATTAAAYRAFLEANALSTRARRCASWCAVADHLGHRNIRNTRVYAQITNPLRDQVFRELEQHPKIVRV